MLSVRYRWASFSALRSFAAVGVLGALGEGETVDGVAVGTLVATGGRGPSVPRTAPVPDNATPTPTAATTPSELATRPIRRRRRRARRPSARRSAGVAIPPGPASKLWSSMSPRSARSPSSSVMPPLRNVGRVGCHCRPERRRSKCLAAARRPALASMTVEIRELDEAALADDVVMREFYDVSRRAELLGREEAPFWTWEEFIGAYRSSDSGERQQVFATYDGDRMTSTAVLWSPLLDNPDKAYFKVDVDVPDRRRGVGSAVLERIEQVAKTDDRQLLMADSVLPFAERETHGYRRFAEACGFELS